ncbi:MAG: MBL fold metallo-hydrolase [Bacteroidales bacterium]|nr:MBL fold metallo-hydrolase [Bacteroidales bacterium]
MKLHKIEAGAFMADGGAMFGVVPKRVWQRRYPCNEENFCVLNMRCLVVKTEDRLMLVDTGTGQKQIDYLKYYRISGVVDFEEELIKLGYSAEEVTDVILTHLHFDHCGSSTKYNEDKTEIVPTFPNADYWVGKTQWENFLNPNVREGDSYFPENMLPIEKAGKLRLVANDQFISPDVEVKIFNGHTVGQLVPYINLGDKTLVYVGDVIPLLASLPIAWVSAYDTFPITSMEDKERMLSDAVEKKQILLFEHDAYNECCTVQKINGKYRVNKIFKLDEIG